MFEHALVDADSTHIIQGYFTGAAPSTSEATLNDTDGYIIWIAGNW